MLAEHFLKRMRAKDGSSLRLSRNAVSYLLEYSWPGNVRELQNIIHRAALLSGGRMIEREHIALDKNEQPGTERRSHSAEEVVISLDSAIEKHIKKALNAAGGKIYGKGGAAELLGLKPTTLQSRMKKLGIVR